MMLDNRLVLEGFALVDGVLYAGFIPGVQVKMEDDRCKVTLRDGTVIVVEGVSGVRIQSSSVAGSGQVGIDL